LNIELEFIILVMQVGMLCNLSHLFLFEVLESVAPFGALVLAYMGKAYMGKASMVMSH